MAIITQKPDNNYFSIAGVQDVRHEGRTFEPLTAGDYDDILKISNVQNCAIIDCKITGRGENREDGIDINRTCQAIDIIGCEVRSGKRYAVTIKGGCTDIFLFDMLIKGERGKEGIDIDLGNYSDSNMIKTTNVILHNVRREDGEPVRIRVGHADKPIVINSKVKILFWWSIAIKIYVWGKYALVKAGLLGWQRKS